ncbi:MAG: DUF2029 domain-containing protein [Anaerolineae bacterium]|nr:DUF2029 domain-containing protein [Anaerolineae bacterium]
MVSVSLAFAPQVTPSDWLLNTGSLSAGLGLYQNPSYVYPPWALILLWPYRLMTARGSLIAAGLVVAWLCSSRGWSLLRMISVIINPYFIFAMMFSNIDILVMILPLLLWETVTQSRWQGPVWGLAIAMLMLKPQGGLLIVPYMVWVSRRESGSLLVAGVTAGLIVLPISLLGFAPPPLILQWLDNLLHPSAQNLLFWEANNISLTSDIGLFPAMLVVVAALLVLCYLFRRAKRIWTHHHTLASLFMLAMLVSPYTSNQSMVVPITLVPSWAAVGIIASGTLLSGVTGIYREYNAWWTLFFGLSALWFFKDTGPVGNAAETTGTDDARE